MTSAAISDQWAPTAGDLRLPTGLCLSYGVGTIAASILLNTVATYFPAFMSTVLGQSPALAGLLLTVSKLYDVVVDVAVGVYGDRTKGQAGRRPYLLVGAVASGIAFFLLFDPPVTQGRGLILFLGLVLMLYSTGYSLFNVPYVAMAPDIAHGYDNRTQLMSYRTFFGSVGQFIALAGAAALVKYGGGGVNGYAMMGAVLALAVVASQLATYWGTRNVREVAPTVRHRIGFVAAIRSLLGNRPGVLLIAAKFLQFVSLACNISTGLLFKLNVLQIGYGGQIQFSTTQNVTMALSMPGWLWAGRRWGKRNCYLAAIMLYALTMLSWLLTAKGIGTVALVWRGVAQGIGAGGMILMSMAMLPDVMEHDHAINGQRREGVYSSIYAVIEKLGFAAGPALMGGYLAWAGYVATTRGALVQQSPAAVRALYAGNAVLPALLLMASFAIMWFYDLDRRQVLLQQVDALDDVAS